MTKILIDEALRLADAIKLGWLENVDSDKADIDMIQAELRRLYAENQALRQAITLAEQPAPVQPLTDEQLEKIWRDGPYDHGTLYDFKLAARAIEAAHGITKGTP